MCIRKTSRSERPLTLLRLLSQRRAEFHRTVNAISSWDSSSLSESLPAFELTAVVRTFIDPTPDDAQEYRLFPFRSIPLITFCRHNVDESLAICHCLLDSQTGPQ